LGARLSVDLARGVELDAMLRTIGRLQPRAVPGYTELNLRIGWHATRHTELWLAGQDLLHARHPELGVASPTRVEFQRAIRIGATLRFQ
jgi:iron complex outermembrane receptor protein